MLRDLRALGAALLLGVALLGCPANINGGMGGGTGSGGGAGGGGGGSGGGSGGGGGGVDAGFARSARGNLRFKGMERLTFDFAAAMQIPVDQLCLELGQYPCTYVVHALAIQGVDPYGTGLYEALPFTGATAPMVVDRTALAACATRVNADLAAPASALIFRGVPLDAQGRLTSPDGVEARAAIVQLYNRVMLREPTDAETARLVQLARDVEAKGGAQPGRDWMKAACFAVLSSAESVFY